jgi:hypothetical protein
MKGVTAVSPLPNLEAAAPEACLGHIVHGGNSPFPEVELALQIMEVTTYLKQHMWEARGKQARLADSHP